MKTNRTLAVAAGLFMLSAFFLLVRAAGESFPIPDAGAVEKCTVKQTFRYTIPADPVLGILREIQPEKIPPPNYDRYPIASIQISAGGTEYAYSFETVLHVGNALHVKAGSGDSYYKDNASVEEALKKLTELTGLNTPDTLLIDTGTLYLYNSAQKTGAVVDGEDQALLAALARPLVPEVGGKALGSRLIGVDAMEIQTAEYKEHYELYENGVSITRTSMRSETDEALYAPVTATFAGDGYKAFTEKLRAVYDKSGKTPAWFAMVNPAKVKRAWRFDETLRSPSSHQGDITAMLKAARIESGSYRMVTNARETLPASNHIEVEFKNDIKYTIIYNDTDILIRSSDMKDGARYQLVTPGNPPFPDPSIPWEYNPGTGKPVIYLYPEKQQDVSVKLDFKGKVTYTYPPYADGWQVTAYPDGKLIDRADGSEHYYLFWEGTADDPWEYQRGSVVRGEDTETFLRAALAKMGLTPREYNDFITYWVPRMRGNAYNLISFSDTQFDEVARLTVTPEPDSVLRVHMVWKAMDAPIQIQPQEFSGFERKGFTVVEWGGTQINGTGGSF